MLGTASPSPLEAVIGRMHLITGNESKRCNVSGISSLAPPAISYPVVIMERIKGEMGSGDTRTRRQGGRPAFRLRLPLGNLILQAGPARYAHLNETIPSASSTAEIKRFFHGFAPPSLAHPTCSVLVVCSGEAVNTHLNLGFRGQVEPVEMGSCIIDGKVMGEQM